MCALTHHWGRPVYLKKSNLHVCVGLTIERNLRIVGVDICVCGGGCVGDWVGVLV